MSMVFDEYGRPFIILKEQQAKSRIKGLQAQKHNIMAARSVSGLLRTSLGPKGMDKMLVDSIGDVTIMNDGATILDKAVEHQVGGLLSSCQSRGRRDRRRRRALWLAGALLEQAEKLLIGAPVRVSGAGACQVSDSREDHGHGPLRKSRRQGFGRDGLHHAVVEDHRALAVMAVASAVLSTLQRGGDGVDGAGVARACCSSVGARRAVSAQVDAVLSVAQTWETTPT